MTQKSLETLRHKQREIRVEVAPVPNSQDAREAYHQGWRTRQV